MIDQTHMTDLELNALIKFSNRMIDKLIPYSWLGGIALSKDQMLAIILEEVPKHRSKNFNKILGALKSKVFIKRVKNLDELVKRVNKIQKSDNVRFQFAANLVMSQIVAYRITHKSEPDYTGEVWMSNDIFRGVAPPTASLSITSLNSLITNIGGS